VTHASRLFRSETWFGFTDARPLALLRVAMGLILIEDWLDRLRDLSAFLGESGIVPVNHSPGTWSLFFWVTRPAGVVALDVVGLVAIVAFTCGYLTRLSTLLTWVFVHSVQHRNLLVCDSGDTLVRVLLFWGLFVDLGGRFSLDLALGRRAPARWIPVLGVRFMQLQVAIMYASTALAKNGPSWANGTAISRAVLNTDFGRPSGVWLAAVPWLCHFLSHATVVIEGGFPILALSGPWQPWSRRAALLAGVGLHLGIFVFMKVGFFSLIVVASYLVFVDAGAVDWAARRFPRLRAVGDEAEPPPSWYARDLCAVLLLQLLVIVHSQIHDVSPPESVELNITGTWQNWHMFSPNPPPLSYRFSAEGLDAEGRPVDVLAAAAPQFAAQGGYRYSRWNKLRSNFETGAGPILPILGRYLCERYNRDPSRPALKSLSLYVDITRLPVPDLPLDARDQPHTLYLKRACSG
jgi:hypothetical protein